MKKVMLLSMGLFWLVIACDNKLPNYEDTYVHSTIAGIWQPTAVSMDNGQKSPIAPGINFDYFEWNDSIGRRVKLKATSLTGDFETRHQGVLFTLSRKQDSIFFNYTSNMNQWREQLVLLNDSILKLRHQNGVIYSYKKHQSLDYGAQ